VTRRGARWLFELTHPGDATVGGGGLTPLDLVSNPFPNGLIQPVGSTEGLSTLVGEQVHASLRHHPTPNAQVYSADFQYQLGNNGVVEMGYSGSQGRQLLYGSFTDLNQLPASDLSLGYAALDKQVANPFYGVIASGNLSGSTIPYWRTLVKYPQFTSVQLLADTPGSSSSFNAVAVKYNQHFALGLNALITYQWSKAIDDSSENNYWEIADAFRDTFDHKRDRSISGHDIPQAFVGTVIWDLPIGRGKTFGANIGPVTNAVLGGWTLNTIVRLNDGLPLHLTQNNNLGNYNHAVSRPNIASMSARVRANARSMSGSTLLPCRRQEPAIHLPSAMPHAICPTSGMQSPETRIWLLKSLSRSTASRVCSSAPRPITSPTRLCTERQT
jgi:hypothetical protein